MIRRYPSLAGGVTDYVDNYTPNKTVEQDRLTLAPAVWTRWPNYLDVCLRGFKLSAQRLRSRSVS